MASTELHWHRVAGPDELPEGRVTTVAAGHKSVALDALRRRSSPRSTTTARTRAARSARARSRTACCAARGTATTTARSTATRRAVRRRGDDVPARDPRRRGLRRRRAEDAARAHRLRRDGRDDGQLGRAARLRHGRPLQPRPRRRAAPPGGGRASSTYIGIRHEGAAAFAASAYGKLTGRPAACLTIAGPGRHQPADRPVGREGRPRAGARAHRPGRRRRCSARAPSRRSTCAARSARSPRWSQTVLPEQPPRRARSTLACKHATARAATSRTWSSPTRCRRCPAPRTRRPARPTGRIADARDRARPRSRSARRVARLARRAAAGDHRRPRRALRHGRA